MHDAVADTVQLSAGSFFSQRQDAAQGLAVVGTLDQFAALAFGIFPVQLGLRRTQALGQAGQGEMRLRFIDQGELDRRAAAVDHQDIACRHWGILRLNTCKPVYRVPID